MSGSQHVVACQRQENRQTASEAGIGRALVPAGNAPHWPRQEPVAAAVFGGIRVSGQCVIDDVEPGDQHLVAGGGDRAGVPVFS